MTDAVEVTKPSERAAHLDPSRPIITISGVGKAYPPRKKKKKPNVVLEDVELQVRPGEFVSLVGASGCGKTTLLRMIGGLTSYFPGEIHVKGQLVRGIPPRIGFVFQDSALMPWRTVWQNVKVGLNERRREFSRQDINEKVDAALGLVGLLEYRDYLPRQISGGMQQRTGLARALVGEPDVLLMDEPFGALDAITRDVLHQELTRVWSEQKLSIVFVTHNVREAARLGQRVVLMGSRPGRVVREWQVDIPQPRTIESPGVSTLAAEITRELHQEISRHAQ
jgi:NitT/TauT family transport system ATP-binding protein